MLNVNFKNLNIEADFFKGFNLQVRIFGHYRATCTR